MSAYSEFEKRMARVKISEVIRAAFECSAFASPVVAFLRTQQKAGKAFVAKPSPVLMLAIEARRFSARALPMPERGDARFCAVKMPAR